MVQIEYLPLVLTGLGLSASIIYYASILRNANKTRQAQLYLHFASQMSSESWANHTWNVMNADYSDFEAFQKWYDTSDKNQISWGIVLNYFENVGVLVKSNLLDIDMVAVGFAGLTRRGWEMMGPIIEETSKEIGDKAIVGKLNVDENPDTAQKFGVMSIPTLIIFKKGEVAKQLVGVQSKETLLDEIKNA